MSAFSGLLFLHLFYLSFFFLRYFNVSLPMFLSAMLNVSNVLYIFIQQSIYFTDICDILVTQIEMRAG